MKKIVVPIIAAVLVACITLAVYALVSNESIIPQNVGNLWAPGQNVEYKIFLGGEEIGKTTVAISSPFSDADACEVVKAAFAFQQSLEGTLKLEGDVECSFIGFPAIVRLTVKSGGEEIGVLIGEVAVNSNAVKLEYIGL